MYKIEQFARLFVEQHASRSLDDAGDRTAVSTALAEALPGLIEAIAPEWYPEEAPHDPVDGDLFAKVTELRVRVGKLRGAMSLLLEAANRRTNERDELRDLLRAKMPDQQSTGGQLACLHRLANQLGLYDAADAIAHLLKS